MTETALRRAALESWGAEHDLMREFIDRLQDLDPALQDAELAKHSAVFVPHLINHYRCQGCDMVWSDYWCCACDDECPTCGKDYSPDDSEVVDIEVLRVDKDRCEACGATHAF